LRLLLVDDDSGLRALLRTTFEVFDIRVDEAETSAEAAQQIDAERPDVVVLDVRMPGESGLDFCRRLKADDKTRAIPVLLLTGSVSDAASHAAAAGADAFMTKPFSPLEVMAVVERLAGLPFGVPFRSARTGDTGEQLLLYARDLRHLLEIERGQRAVIQSAYRETVAALAGALEKKDTGTRKHSQRVQHYALALAKCVQPSLAQDPSSEYGFLLHDVGKIGIPDRVLQKPGPLTAAERRLMQTHTALGEQMLDGVGFLQGHGLRIVRSHHERWDGTGYPDELKGEEIPIGARIFAVADTLDAITSFRPYRRAQSWKSAVEEITAHSGTQFDPDVVAAFRDCERDLQDVRREMAAA
jgi:ribonuclease P protein subunit RPR2